MGSVGYIFFSVFKSSNSIPFYCKFGAHFSIYKTIRPTIWLNLSFFWMKIWKMKSEQKLDSFHPPVAVYFKYDAQLLVRFWFLNLIIRWSYQFLHSLFINFFFYKSFLFTTANIKMRLLMCMFSKIKNVTTFTSKPFHKTEMMNTHYKTQDKLSTEQSEQVHSIPPNICPLEVLVIFCCICSFPPNDFICVNLILDVFCGYFWTA